MVLSEDYTKHTLFVVGFVLEQKCFAYDINYTTTESEENGHNFPRKVPPKMVVTSEETTSFIKSFLRNEIGNVFFHFPHQSVCFLMNFSVMFSLIFLVIYKIDT